MSNTISLQLPAPADLTCVTKWGDVIDYYGHHGVT